MNPLFRKTWRDLRAARAQALALIVIVALGVASFIVLSGAYRDLSTSYNRTYKQLKFADVTFSVEAAPGSAADAVRGLDGVAAVTGRLIVDTGLELPDGEPVRARLIGIPSGERPAVNDVFIKDGRFLSPTDKHAAVLETRFAEIHGLRPGATVTPIIRGQKAAFEVVGIGASPEYLVVSPSRQDFLPSARTFAVLFVPLDQLQALVGQEGVVNDIAVRVAEGASRAAVVQAVRAELEPYQLQTTTLQEDQPSNAALKSDLEGYRELANLMPAMILVVAAVSVYVMLGRQVRAQQPQVGLMKALGYSSRAVMGHYLAFALTIGVVGSTLGLLLGLPLLHWTTSAYAAEMGIPLVETRIYPDLMGESLLLSLIVSILAGLGPARAAARLAPAVAMRLDPSVALVKGRASLLERIIRVPLRLRLPLRNVFRVRRRSYTTALGVIFAYMLVLMVWGMFDSMSTMLGRYFQDVERWDVVATFDLPQTGELLAKVRNWPGVRQAEPILQLPVSLNANGKERDVLLTALDPSQDMHVLQLPHGLTPETALEPRHIVLTTALADTLGLKKGDTLTLSTPAGQQEFILGGTSEEFVGTTAYISLAEVQRLVGTPALVYNGLYLTTDPAATKAIKADLYHQLAASSVQLKADLESDLQSMMGLFYLFMGVILVFVVGMAFALLFNTMTVNVLERRRELATMRSLGTGRGSIALLISAESVVLWLLTIAPGLVAGWWVAQQIGQTFSSDLLSFKVTIAPSSYVFTALGILATMLLAALPAIRNVNRLNLAEATKVLT